MQFKTDCKWRKYAKKLSLHKHRKWLRYMRWTAYLLLITCLHVAAKSYEQTVSITGKNLRLEKLFARLKAQTGFHFFYKQSNLTDTKPVNIHFSNAKLEDILDETIKPQGLDYSIQGHTVFINKAKNNQKVAFAEFSQSPPPQEPIRGRVVDSLGNPLAGATIKIKGTTTATVADKDGWYTIETKEPDPILEISYIGYQTITIKSSNNALVVLSPAFNILDENIVMAYGTTSRRYNTGNISKVTAKEIEEQPVGNVLQALQGRVPGLNVTSTSGVPGASVKIQVRGQNSIIGGNDPLILIDGTPFGPNNNDINSLSSAINSTTAIGEANGGLSAFSSINPMDIESVEVLKDADATAIYGSRGANGVILITTKKGKAGNTKFNFNIYSGVSKATRLPKMMNTEQYLAMRHEAFNNDGETPTQDNAPDLRVFDTTHYTDFVKEYFGGTANMTNVYGSVNGGTGNTQYVISGTYREENNIYSHEKKNKIGTIFSNINTSSKNNKFKINFNTSYTYNQNNQTAGTLSTLISSAPDFPGLLDSSGNLVWYYNGVNINNPLRYLKYIYVASTENLNTNLQLNYEILKGLVIRSNVGYNKVWLIEKSLAPGETSNPENGITRYAEFNHNNISSWSMEPQLEYNRSWNKNKLDILLGGAWLSSTTRTEYVYASGQSSDALLEDLTSATTTTLSNSYSLYRYQAFFGRINYNHNNKYLLNFTGRRDGSSRFGDNHKFSNFGALGVGWIFSNEQLLKDNMSFLSFGKLRGSWGITGNDQIGNYQYLDSWESTTYKYGSYAGLQPTRLANNDFSWEKNKKIELALELGFLQDRILLTSSWFRNRSGNMLINYNIPSQTGFTSILKNFPGLVQNRGWEITLNTKPIIKQYFNWAISANITIPRNKLLTFPNLATSPYSYTYIIGQSLSNTQGYTFTGVNPQTGLFTYKDSDGDGTPDWGGPIGNLAPKFYGGISNAFQYKHFSLDIFLEFKKQLGYSYLANLYSSSPGIYGVLTPVVLEKRWQQPGDITDIQKLTQSTSSDAYTMASMFNFSNGAITDASYIRFKTVSLGYSLNAPKLKALKLEGFKVYATAQNLLTLTGYKIGDPETQNLRTLPPLRTYVLGIQITF